MPTWRSLLEERWQQRLSTLTELSLAYHDAHSSNADGGVRVAKGGRAGRANRASLVPKQSAQLKALLREATAARRALSDTEEALARLSDGDFGLCEQCSALIPAIRLLAEPETRYCADCVEAVV
jgi:DnaK suppressor protein